MANRHICGIARIEFEERGIQCLSAVGIHRISGLTVPDFLEQRIVKPLNLDGLSIGNADTQMHRIPHRLDPQRYIVLECIL